MGTIDDPLGSVAFGQEVPHERFAAWRRDDPVRRHDPGDGSAPYWSVVRHADVVAVTRDPVTFSSQSGGTTMEDVAPHHLDARRSLIDTDGVEHGLLRRLVSPRLTPAGVARDWTAFVDHLVEATLDRAFASDELDVVHDIAAPIPITVLGELLGLPDQDRLALMHLGDEMIAGSDPDHAPRTADGPDERFAGYPFASPAGKDLWEYADRLRADRRDHLGHDVFSLLMTGQIDGRSLTGPELDNYFSLLVVAGNETTRMALSHAVWAFASFPDQLTRLREEPELLGTAVEEVLRWSTPLHHFRRTATRRVELGGRTIEAGDKVVIWYISANRDETVFADPMTFDIGRQPNPHVAFGGGGPHFCLGNSLARLEIASTLRSFASRVSRVELTGDVRRTRSNLTHGVKELPVRLTYAPAPSLERSPVA